MANRFYRNGWCVLLVPLLLYACTQEGLYKTAFYDDDLSVEKAKSYYEAYIANSETRTEVDQRLPFILGDALWHWEQAKESASDNRSAVDIPISNNFVYKVYRPQPDGSYTSVYTQSSIVSVQNDIDGEISFYIRIMIPESDEENVDEYLNYGKRKHYNGLEYYISLDGSPVAIAKYEDGSCVESVFLGDTSLTHKERMSCFASLFRGLCIARVPNGTRAQGEMEYGKPGEIFCDQNGSFYTYVDIDGDGKSDAVTGLFDDSAIVATRPSYGGASGTSGSSNSSGSTSSSSSSSSNSSSSGSLIGGSSGSGTGGGSIGTGGSSPGAIGVGGVGSGYSGTTSGSNTGATTDSASGGLLDAGSASSASQNWSTELEHSVNPLRHIIILIPAKDKPKSDLANGKADPLLDMSNGICPTPGGGIAGGRFGYKRNSGKTHNGLDLKAEVGTNVYAMFDCTITFTCDKYSSDVPWGKYDKVYDGRNKISAAGNRIWMDCTLPSGEKLLIKYFHLESVNVKVGDQIKSGDLVGTVGKTGSASSGESGGPHLHLEVYKNGLPVNPEKYLYTPVYNY